MIFSPIAQQASGTRRRIYWDQWEYDDEHCTYLTDASLYFRTQDTTTLLRISGYYFTCIVLIMSVCISIGRVAEFRTRWFKTCKFRTLPRIEKELANRSSIVMYNP